MDSPSSPRPLTPWLSLVGIIMLQSISGTNANFPAYSSKLKQLLFLSSLQLNNLIVASEAGKLFGCFPDVAAKHLPLWAMLIIGAILGLIGYGVQFLFLVNKITSISYWQLILLHFIAGNSICWINTVCCLAAASNFRIDHPSIIALTMTYSGLSGKVYTSMVQGVHGHGSTKPSTYLLLNCIVPIGVSLVFSTLVRDPKQEEIVETGRFSAVFIMATATGAYVVFESVAPAFKEVSPRLRVAILVLMIMLPLVMPIVMVVERFPFDKWKFKVSSRGESDFKHKRVIAETRINTGGEIVEDEKGGGEKERAGMVKNKEVNAETVTKEGDAQNVTKEGNDSKVLTVKEENEEKAVKVRVGDEHGMKELLLSVDFWLYFGVYACGATLSTVYLNNLGRISKSRGNCASFLLAISSAFGFFGRLFTVMLDRLTRGNNVLSRPVSMVFMMIPMAASFFLLLNDSALSLYITTAILGTFSGIMTTITASTTSQLFGSKNSCTNLKIVLANIPLGSLLFGSLSALNYDMEVNGSHGICFGFECYRKIFIIWGSFSSVGTILCFVLYFRTRKFYLERL